MAIVYIDPYLEKQINRRFKKESIAIFKHIMSLRDDPKKGKTLTHVGKIVIKELKYKKLRFYFITDGNMVKVLPVSQLKDLIIKVVGMSEKKDQQKTIDEIKRILKTLGDEGF